MLNTSTRRSPAIVLVLTLASGNAFAEYCEPLVRSRATADTTPSVDCLWIGTGASASQSEYADQSGAESYPVVHLEYGPLYWMTSTIGLAVAAFNSSGSQSALALQLSLPEDGFDAASDTALLGLDDRPPTLEGGIAIHGSGALGIWALDIGVDLEGKHDGIRATAQYAWPLKFGSVSVSPGLSLSIQDASRAQYYYGLDSDEANRTQRSTYTIDHPTTRFGLGWSVVVPIHKHWTLFHTLSVERFDDRIDASPLTRRDTAISASVGILFRFTGQRNS